VDLSPDMRDALYDLGKHHPSARGPTFTGLSKRTFTALARRGLVEQLSEKYWRLTGLGIVTAELAQQSDDRTSASGRTTDA
jgi:hypothetical protein